VRQGLRALLDMTNNVCVVIALRHISLTMFYILIFTSPLLVALLSSVFLREHLGAKKLFALLLGFIGVVTAVAPWSHEQRIDLIGFLCCMICVTCFSINMVWSRVLTRTEPPESMAFCSGVVTAITGLALTGTHARPLTISLTALLLLMGVFCAAGTSCFYFAVKHTSASNVSQYHYTQLLTGAIVSYVVWHELPGPWMLLGGTLILGSGAMIALAARQAQQRKAA
jgi:drug/metabolite transporter (DMT)-like permease